MSTKINWTRLMMLLLLGTLATGCGNSYCLNVAGDNGFITGNDVVFGVRSDCGDNRLFR